MKHEQKEEEEEDEEGLAVDFVKVTHRDEEVDAEDAIIIFNSSRSAY